MSQYFKLLEVNDKTLENERKNEKNENVKIIPLVTAIPTKLI